MNMLFEGLKEKGSMVIVPASALESMNLGSQLGLAAFARDPALATVKNSGESSGGGARGASK